jgi:hypothetical protein
MIEQDSSYLRLLLESPKDSGFFLLKIPCDYLMLHRSKLSIRKTQDHFDLHISGKKINEFSDIRGEGLDFKRFKV